MDNENKYKEAKRLYQTANADQRYVLESLFPELKESEDERIRKTLVEFFTDWGKSRSHCWSVSIPKILAWLEKQGEKLPVGFYYVNSEGKKFYSDTFKYGDVTLHVEKQGEQKPTLSEGNERIREFLIEDIKDTLSSEDFRNYNPEHAEKLKEALAWLRKQNKQKHVWSEEDEKELNSCIEAIEACYKWDTMVNWLKSLKDRYTWKPSAAQMASITCAVRKMKESACYDSELVSLLNDLKKLKGE